MGVLKTFKKVTNPFTHSLDLEKKIEQFERLQNNIKEVSLANQQKACSLYESRKKSIGLLQCLDVYIKSLSNCPESIIQGCNRALTSMKNIMEAIDFEESELAKERIKGKTASIAGATGVVAGSLTATVGPTAAMAIATTFGTASTGTAIATLGGAAATNAALAWLGGGAVAMGGAGMAGGATLLAILGPIGWGMAGLTLVGSTLFSRNHNIKEIKKIQEEIDKLAECCGKLTSAKKRLDYIYAKTEEYNSLLIPNKYKSQGKDYAEEAFRKEELFMAVSNAKFLGKLSSEAVFPQ